MKWDVPTDNRGLLPSGNSAAYNRKERVMSNSNTYVGMDTHKKQHTVTVHFPRSSELVVLTVKNNTRDIARIVKKISNFITQPPKPPI